MDVDLTGAAWHKSTYSNGSGGDCVEVAPVRDSHALRDSKDPDGPVLQFSASQWLAFIQGVKLNQPG